MNDIIDRAVLVCRDLLANATSSCTQANIQSVWLYLDEMWQKRSAREQNFASIVNSLQGALIQCPRLDKSKVQCILDIFEMLPKSPLDNNDIRKVNRLLRAAGLDPFAWLSGLSSNEGD